MKTNKQLLLYFLLLAVLAPFYSFGQLNASAIPPDKREWLNAIAGRWITQTTVAGKGQHYKTLGSDVYQWSPDGNFMVHTAYGIRDSSGFGAMEIIGYNPATDDFTSYNFNPDGSFTMDKLIIRENAWIWSSKKIRSMGVMDKEKKRFIVKHETSSDGVNYTYLMESRLTKGAEF